MIIIDNHEPDELFDRLRDSLKDTPGTLIIFSVPPVVSWFYEQYRRHKEPHATPWKQEHEG